MATPSKRRRSGREAFIPDEIPRSTCSDFLEGWTEAREAYAVEQERLETYCEQHEYEFDHKGCLWCRLEEVEKLLAI